MLSAVSMAHGLQSMPTRRSEDHWWWMHWSNSLPLNDHHKQGKLFSHGLLHATGSTVLPPLPLAQLPTDSGTKAVGLQDTLVQAPTEPAGRDLALLQTWAGSYQKANARILGSSTQSARVDSTELPTGRG